MTAVALLALLAPLACHKPATSPSETGADTSAVPDGVYDFEVADPFAAPVDPLAGSDVESCSVYQDEDCTGGARRVCEVYDPGTGQWVTEVDPLYKRALLFDRWLDKYDLPDGVVGDRITTVAFPPGTPEAQWAHPSVFYAYNGNGDGAIWTGAATNAAVMRYLETGTEADRARVERMARTLVTDFDVTGVPGYLARSPWLLVGADTPADEDHLLYTTSGDTDYAMEDPAAAPDLPAAYTEGWTDINGEHRTGTPMWSGHPSIDQYTGPLIALPEAYPFLHDDALKARIVTHLSCYLNRLQRIEIVHLQDNPDAQAMVQGLLTQGQLDLDPGDLDFSTLDRLVGYGLLNFGDGTRDSYDRTCPAAPATQATRVIDATDSDFVAQLLQLALDLSGTNGATCIDHLYMVSLRGGDAIHLMHLGAIAYYLTGDEAYKSFVLDVLEGELGAVAVANTTGAFLVPDWCRSYYGDHITFSPLWAFIELLQPSPLRTEMEKVMHTELQARDVGRLGNTKFQLMYAGAVSSDIALQADQARSEALASIEQLGGNGGILDDPRRGYDASFEEVAAQLPEGTDLVCPTEQQRAQCEDGFQVMGLSIPGTDITGECTGAASDCPVGDGCATAIASEPLPPPLRHFTDFMWQRDPFEVGGTSYLANWQSSGIDVTEPYWLARHYGLLKGGEGQVLAWHEVGSCK